jgi:hydroxyacylglutathione hydrolase
MKKLNRDGPRFSRVPVTGPADRGALDRALSAGAVVVDLRRTADYAVAHVPGTISIPLDASFTNWAGWLVPYTADFYLIAPDRGAAAVDHAVRELAMIGLDRVAGWSRRRHRRMGAAAESDRAADYACGSSVAHDAVTPRRPPTTNG